MISDENNQGVAAGIPWKNSNVPTEFAITGLGPVFVRVSQLEHIRLILEKVLGFKETDHSGDFYLFEIGEGGMVQASLLNIGQTCQKQSKDLEISIT